MGKRSYREIYYCEERQCYVVPLTKGYEALIDKASIPLVDGRSWQVFLDVRSCGRIVGYARRSSRRAGKRQLVEIMHRVITSAPSGLDVDHINGDGLDNRLSNLRVVTRTVNARNTHAHRGGRLVGCYFDKAKKAWRAQIKDLTTGERVHLGHFATEVEAHEVFMEADKAMRGGVSAKVWRDEKARNSSGEDKPFTSPLSTSPI